METYNQPEKKANHFAKADVLLAEASALIEAGRHDATTGAAKTCDLILTLLAGVRTPVRRLSQTGREAAHG